jgi:signal transduction histidine kinase
LERIAFLIARIIATVSIRREVRDLRRELEEERYKILSASVAVAYDSLLQGFLHQYKKELRDFYASFKKLYNENLNSREKSQIINNKISFIEKRFEEIQSELALDSFEKIDINKVINIAVENFSFELQEKEIELSVQLFENIPLVEINETKLKIVIFNLLSNAIIAVQKVEKSKISVATSIITLNREQYIQIVIEDNGVGIDNKVGEKIFNKGFTTCSKDERGTGMGLFLARDIINNYNGMIYYNSAVGKGTSFFVNIPLQVYQV